MISIHDISKRKLPITKSIIAVLFFFLIIIFTGNNVFAQEVQDKLNQLNKQIEDYQTEVLRLNAEANTLSNQIAQYNAQINLTTLKISQTEEKISLLGGRIDQLEASLDSLSSAFTSRVNQSYKLSRISDPYIVLLSSNSLSGAVSNFYYLEKIQEADRNLLIKLEDAQSNYKEEKVDQEDLHVELENQKSVLGTQKTAKAKLLDITRNDEKKYQSLLVQARAERDAIQDIIAGKGKETEVGDIKEGSRIASVIPGASACSSGAHLHFEVVKSNTHQNPTSFLTPKSVIWDNSPDGQFGFSGNWQWPINDPVRITQGYGMTYYAVNLRYYGGAPHTGIDMINANNDMTVKAVKDGKLFRGAIACGGGTLRYVRVSQSEGIDTYYLHVNY
ncbi:hypothetical protein IPM62_04960 [Candidatus Woesebacteria bacterium]|nr:MAG: hypothetical protein IPM62_04960 [Candidatus Woesebacteria bacterium]